jgi:arylsulfatase A-like enzyme
MNRILQTLLCVLCAFVVQSGSAAKPHRGQAERLPNIIVFLTDDQGYGDLGCYGSTNIATPNVDRLRAEGMKFNSFYVHNRCSPTRMAFMTGSHARRAGASKVIYRKDRMGINAEEITVPELLRKAAFTTGMVGKWHLGEWPQFNPIHHGFDSFYGFMEYDDSKSTAIFRDREIVERIRSKTDGTHSPKLLKAGIEFIEANRHHPFFLYYASPLPHTKWKPNGKFAGTSEQGTYGDVVQEIDWQVGALMDKLDELGLSKNTLFVFASDNGPQLNVEGHGSSGALRDGKWTDFEGGIRVPCIMRWPGNIPAGSINNQITGIIDLLPTFCAIAGIEVPTDRVIDGRNILPYLHGEKADPPIHETFVVPDSTIRHGDWKLFVKAQKPGGGGTKGMPGRKPAKAGSLFDLKGDAGETTDISEQHPEKVRELRRQMEPYMRQFNANIRPIGRVD